MKLGVGSGFCRTIFAMSLLPLAAVAFAQAAPTATEDTSRWRYLTHAGEAGMLVTASTDEQTRGVRTLSTYTVLGQPHESGVDGLLTNYEVDCRRDTIKDLGSTAFAGDQNRGAVASATNNEARDVPPSTVFFVISEFACNGRVPATDRTIVTGRAAAIAHARRLMTRRR